MCACLRVHAGARAKLGPGLGFRPGLGGGAVLGAVGAVGAVGHCQGRRQSQTACSPPSLCHRLGPAPVLGAVVGHGAVLGGRLGLFQGRRQSRAAWTAPPLSHGFKTSARNHRDFFEDVGKQLQKVEFRPVPAYLPDHLVPPPPRVDVVIVGGGVVAWAIAYWVKKLDWKVEKPSVLVVERDPTYSQNSSVLSAGGIRTQFSLPENILLSLHSAEFIRDINKHLDVRGEPPVDVNFNHAGYLFLANEETAHIMEENHRTQLSVGAKVRLLSPAKLKEKFPWLNTDGVALASYGLEDEGWFDPWSLLFALRRKALYLGAMSYNAEVTGFTYTSGLSESPEEPWDDVFNINTVSIQPPDVISPYSVRCRFVINAAGAHSARVCSLLDNRCLEELMPVEPRKRYVYVVDCPDGPGLDTPFLIDYSGTYFRRDGLGGLYLAGASPPEGEEPDIDDLEVDDQFFQDKIWPNLAQRVPGFNRLKVVNAWAGYYDYNTFDQNALVGFHPQIENMIVATGFSGHGLQHAPAVGRAVMELLRDNQYKTIDLSGLGFKRILNRAPKRERNIV